MAPGARVYLASPARHIIRGIFPGGRPMRSTLVGVGAAAALLGCAVIASAQTDAPDKPTWWNKYQYLSANGSDTCAARPSIKVGANVDVSNECGPQSETFVA